MIEETVVTEEPTSPPQEAENVAPVETAEPTPAPADDTTAKPEQSGIQKRINELTWKQREAERQAEYWRQQAERPSETKAPSGKPTLEQFEYDNEAYTEALVAHQAKEQFEKFQAQQNQQMREYEANQRAMVFEAKAAEFSKQAPDFADVISQPSLHITEQMREVIELSDNGPALAYHLGKNPQKTAEIAAMSPLRAAATLGKIEAAISMAKPKSTTTAPPPIQPMGGGDASMKDPAKMTMEEYAAFYKANLRR